MVYDTASSISPTKVSSFSAVSGRHTKGIFRNEKHLLKGLRNQIKGSMITITKAKALLMIATNPYKGNNKMYTFSHSSNNVLPFYTEIIKP
jgi:hypothetical protein